MAGEATRADPIAPTVGLIWAQNRGGVIGRAGTIPWHLPEDMTHFREVTAGHTVVMGRRTWDSLPGRFRPLPGRRNVVLTREPTWRSDGAQRADSVAGALTGRDEVWVIGGGEIYTVAMPFATLCVVTEIDVDVEGGDTYAPRLDSTWNRVAETWQTSAKSGLRYRFVRYTR